MYDLLDRPVTSLTAPARFLLWAMRGWAQATAKAQCPPMALRQGFWTHHAHQSLPDFHIAMSMLNRHAIQTIALAPLPCTRIAEAEAILLNLWRDLALARQERANATIALLVTADHGTALCRCMNITLARMALSGMDLSDLSLPPESIPHHE